MPVPAGAPEVRQLLRPEQEVDQVHLRNLPLLCHKIQVINGERDVKEKNKEPCYKCAKKEKNGVFC